MLVEEQKLKEKLGRLMNPKLQMLMNQSKKKGDDEKLSEDLNSSAKSPEKDSPARS